MAENETVSRLLSRLRNQCSRREYCTADVRTRALKALDGDGEAAEAVVELLKKDGYVDDGRYCAAYAREKSSISGWGEVKIRHMLSCRGLSPEDIASGLAETDAGQASARLHKLLAVKRKSLDGDPQCRLKLLRFAIGRGYRCDEVMEALKEMERE